MNKRDLNHPQNIEESVISSHINNMMTSHVVKVTEVNTKLKTVNAEIMVQLSDGDNEATDYGPLNNIPYARLQGGGYGIICDPQVGDIGIVVFSARDFSNVKKTKAKTIPASNRTYDIADGIYIASLLMSDPSTYIKIDGSGVTIKGNLTVHGKIEADNDITTTGDVNAGSISLKNHTHTKGNNGSPTGKPIGS